MYKLRQKVTRKYHEVSETPSHRALSAQSSYCCSKFCSVLQDTRKAPETYVRRGFWGFLTFRELRENALF
nr:MAG TPA: hypothetical protein [Caudoviricetes sp.]